MAYIDQLDSNERNDDAADAINEQVAPQHCCSRHWLVTDSAKCERNQRDDDQRIEDDRG